MLNGVEKIRGMAWTACFGCIYPENERLMLIAVGGFAASILALEALGDIERDSINVTGG